MHIIFIRGPRKYDLMSARVVCNKGTLVHAYVMEGWDDDAHEYHGCFVTYCVFLGPTYRPMMMASVIQG